MHEIYTWDADNQEYNEAGSYQVLLQSIHGCDSLVTLNLDILGEADEECMALSTDDFSNENLLTIFPNPASGHLNLELTKGAKARSYIIRDHSSKLISQGTLSKDKQVSLSDLESGLYIISIQLEDKSEIHKKFIKIEN